MNKLFEVPETPPTKSEYKCQHCEHAERWKCGTRYIWYCGARKSKQTSNGLLKIKARNDACLIFKIEENGRCILYI